MIDFRKWLIINSDELLKLQRSDGSFVPGHNGPYFDEETPVRNTAHFLFLSSSLYEKTQNSKYKNASYKAIEYLNSSDARPKNGTFYCRNKKGKDSCNGLVGQAWVIEALVKASEVFKRDDCYKLAEEVFLLHPWNEGISIWNRVEIDGCILSVDRTFNHQLWFAMSAAMLNKTAEAQRRAKCFLNVVAKNIEIYDDGVIFHNSQLGALVNYRYLGWRYVLRQVKAKILKGKLEQELYSKSVGYHGFNLYAFAVLKKLLPKEPLWQGNLMAQLLEACEHPLFLDTLQTSDYGYFYNLAGLEIAHAYEQFSNNDEKSQSWIHKQFIHSYNPKSMALTKNVADINTAYARIYVAARLKGNYTIE